MAMAKVFHNSVPNCKVFHPNGRQITFANGKCITSIKLDIDYLELMVAEGDAYISIDPNEFEVDTDDLTEEGRVKKLQAEAVEAYKAQVALASKQESTSNQHQGVLPVTSSMLINSVESNSNAPAPAPVETPAPGVKVSTPATK